MVCHIGIKMQSSQLEALQVTKTAHPGNNTSRIHDRQTSLSSECVTSGFPPCNRSIGSTRLQQTVLKCTLCHNVSNSDSRKRGSLFKLCYLIKRFDVMQVLFFFFRGGSFKNKSVWNVTCSFSSQAADLCLSGHQSVSDCPHTRMHPTQTAFQGD